MNVVLTGLDEQARRSVNASGIGGPKKAFPERKARLKNPFS